MTIDETFNHLREHSHEITDRIKAGRYTPSAVRRVEIPKPDAEYASLVFLPSLTVSYSKPWHSR